MNALHTISRLKRLADQRAGLIFLAGLAGAAIYNGRLWQRDRAQLAAQAARPPLPPLEAWPQLPRVSVLVAAWNEAENIAGLMESFLRLRYPHKELVLCAGGPDGTYEIVEKCKGETIVVLRQQAGEGKQRALRRCLGSARGEVIFLTDADCLLANDPFEQTLWPVAAGLEQAATGSSRPLESQLSDPFAYTQAATQVYAALNGPAYAPGLRGCNCAVNRALLDETRALDVPAPTGTDYVLAKTLTAAGVNIRQVPTSLMPTEFPSAPRAYLRQQRRWLRNVALYGRQYGAVNEMRLSLRTSLVGLAMLILPLPAALLSPGLLAVWGALVMQALSARLRYLFFAASILNRPVRPIDTAWQPPLLFLDFIAWIQPLADYVSQRARQRW